MNAYVSQHTSEHAAHKPARMHALWWGLFAVGGMTAALLLPIHILFQGILAPLGLVPVAGKIMGATGLDVSASYESMRAALANPLVRLYLLALIALPLYHVAHRLLYVTIDLRLGIPRPLLGLLFYGGAVLGTVLTIGVLATV
ncbi:MAG: fumarate reductase subunit FrdD [Chloroflexota bacterium]